MTEYEITFIWMNETNINLQVGHTVHIDEGFKEEHILDNKLCAQINYQMVHVIAAVFSFEVAY